MGQTVSTGVDNDELIDNLVEADYIKTTKIQRIFRAVDRANYFLEGQKENAYRDSAWRAGNLHLSAPCVYSGVMESLQLREGLSFLNLGSGCGYLSTMAGLILGQYGINHGIELFTDVVDYAYNKLDEFVKQSDAVDEYDFCEPTFLSGNCLKIDNTQLYDRVYCGAGCPLEYETYMKHLIKVGGVLIMPLNNKLLQITRTASSTWESVMILSVSFAPLISPFETEAGELVKLPDFTPPSLQILTRSKIRSTLRSIINVEHPDLQESRASRCTNVIRRQVRRIVIPLLDETDTSDSDSDSNFVEFRNPSAKITIGRLPTAFIKNFFRSRTDIQNATPGPSQPRETNAETSQNENNSTKTSQTEDEAKEPKNDNKNDLKEEDTSSDSESDGSGSVLEELELPESTSSSLDETSVDLPKKENSRKRQHSSSESTSHPFKRRVSTMPRKNTQHMHSRIASVICKRLPPPEYIRNAKKTAEKKATVSKENTLNYRKLMAEKIQLLPLPARVQMYINYRRDNL